MLLLYETVLTVKGAAVMVGLGSAAVATVAAGSAASAGTVATAAWVARAAAVVVGWVVALVVVGLIPFARVGMVSRLVRCRGAIA